MYMHVYMSFDRGFLYIVLSPLGTFHSPMGDTGFYLVLNKKKTEWSIAPSFSYSPAA